MRFIHIDSCYQKIQEHYHPPWKLGLIGNWEAHAWWWNDQTAHRPLFLPMARTWSILLMTSDCWVTGRLVMVVFYWTSQHAEMGVNVKFNGLDIFNWGWGYPLCFEWPGQYLVLGYSTAWHFLVILSSVTAHWSFRVEYPLSQRSIGGCKYVDVARFHS